MYAYFFKDKSRQIDKFITLIIFIFILDEYVERFEANQLVTNMCLEKFCKL